MVVWLVVSHWQTQRSLGWWYRHQASQQAQAAEFIRDGVLQAAFSLRRSLELSLLNAAPTPPTVQRELLTTFDHIHQDLKILSDRLSPPYWEDSLPLAIQHLLADWQRRYPSLKLVVTLPAEWQHSPTHHHPILMLLNACLQVSLTQLTSELVITLNLQQHGQYGVLDLTICPENSLVSFPYVQEFHYLEHISHLLMPGRCDFRQKRTIIYGSIKWRLS